MSRRALGLGLALTMLLGMLSGCGSKTSSAASSAGSFGETVSNVEEASVNSSVESASTTGSFSMPYNDKYGWNPFACTGMENRAVMQLIYEGLFTMNETFDAEPVLCKSYTVSDDGLVYTLTLQSAAFSSGASMTADDVVYSMEQASSSDLYGSRFEDVSTFYASDDGTVTVELSTPNDRLPCLLTFPIVPRSGNADAPVGTGPFVRSADTALTQNIQWWQGMENLNFQSVTLYSSSSAEDTRDNFEIDNVHFVYNNPNSSTAATFHCDYELWNSRSTVMQYIGFNFNSGVFQDKSVRAALTHAIDRSSIAETVYHNFADAASLPVAPSSSMYDADLAQSFAFTSVKDAQDELLSTSSFYLPDNKTVGNAGDGSSVEETVSPSVSEIAADETHTDTAAADGDTADTAADDETAADSETTYNNITMIVRSGNTSRVAAAKAVAQCLTDVGFTVDLQVLDSDAFQSALDGGDWDLYYADVTLKPDFDLRAILTSDGSLNFGGFSGDSDLASLTASAMENSGNRYDLYEYIMNQGYLCPVLFLNNAVFTTRGVFTGLNPAPDNLFYQIANVHVNHQ